MAKLRPDDVLAGLPVPAYMACVRVALGRRLSFVERVGERVSAAVRDAVGDAAAVLSDPLDLPSVRQRLAVLRELEAVNVVESGVLSDAGNLLADLLPRRGERPEAVELTVGVRALAEAALHDEDPIAEGVPRFSILRPGFSQLEAAQWRLAPFHREWRFVLRLLDVGRRGAGEPFAVQLAALQNVAAELPPLESLRSPVAAPRPVLHSRVGPGPYPLPRWWERSGKLGLPAIAGDDWTNARDWARRGQRLVDAGDLDAAEPILRAVMHGHDFWDRLAAFQLGRICEARGGRAQAARYYGYGVKVPGFGLELARLLIEDGELPAAAHALWWVTAEGKMPDIATGALRLGAVMETLGDPESAAAAYFLATHSGLADCAGPAAERLGQLLGAPQHATDPSYVYPVPLAAGPATSP